jgi:type I restriction enzyme S subunit
MKRLLVPRPDDRVTQAWNAVAGPLHERAFQNALEIHDLSTMRDTLLPKLISGELRVKDHARFLEGVVA